MYIIVIFILIVLAVILFVGLSIVGTILRAIFGIGRRASSRPKQSGYDYTNQRPSNESQNTYSSQTRSKKTSGSNERKKIFTKDDGEYVDFEEM